MKRTPVGERITRLRLKIEAAEAGVKAAEGDFKMRVARERRVKVLRQRLAEFELEQKHEELNNFVFERRETEDG